MDIKIIQQNVCGEKLYKCKWRDEDFSMLIDFLIERDPDILFLTEFCHKKMIGTIQEKLPNFKFVMPKELSEKDKNSNSLYASCFMAYKNEKISIDPNLEGINDMLKLRYICGRVLCNDIELFKILFMYVPQTYNAPLNRIVAKRKMLNGAKYFINKNLEEKIFVCGDMNSDIDYCSTSCINDFAELYDLLIDTDIHKHPTWKYKRLDYALISKNKNISGETLPLKTNSDHAGLETVLHINGY